MANDVKWIKITTDMFDNRKIKHLRRLPDGNNIVLIWVMLLTMAGRCNAGGMIFLTENIPYTPKMLADELDFEENTVQLALTVLEQLNMIVMQQGFFAIAGWEEHQNIDGLDKIREKNRIRQAKYREKQKLLQGNNLKGDVTVALHNAVDIDKEEEKELEKEREKEGEIKQVYDLYTSLCPSLLPVKSLTAFRKQAILSKLEEYSVDDFRQCFEAAEASSFLTGDNDRAWIASLDWILDDDHMARTLEGLYVNRVRPAKATESGRTNDKNTGGNIFARLLEKEMGANQ